MLVTIDTSVVMAVLLEEPSKKDIVALSQGSELQAPPSLYWEVGNALSALLRRKLLNLKQANQAVQAFDSIPIRLADVELTAILDIVDRHSIWAYDAFVIECARKYRTPLMSLDKAQCRVAVAEGVEVLEVSS